MAHFDNNGFLAVKISQQIISLYDYKNSGINVGSISSVYTSSTQRSGISIHGIRGKDFFIGYKDSEDDTTVNVLMSYTNINENSLPYIKNTVSGTLFPHLSGGGIQVQNGLIKNWNMSGTWSGTYNVQVGNAIYQVSVQDGLMTNIQQVV